MKIGLADLGLPGEVEPGRGWDDPEPTTGDACPECQASWTLDDLARITIGMQMHREEPWIVLRCPDCLARYRITGSGKMIEVVDERIKFSVKQYWMARILDGDPP